MVIWFERPQLYGICLLPVKVLELFDEWKARRLQPSNFLRCTGGFLRIKVMSGQGDAINL
jgi:hypothetical protein